MDLATLLNILIPLVTSFAGYFFGYRQNKAQAEGTEMDNVDKAVKIWRQLTEDLEKKIEGERVECDRKMEAQAQRHKTEIQRLENRIKQLEAKTNETTKS